MNSVNGIRSALIDELVNAGDLIRRGEDFFEDMGGHILHESNLDDYITSYLNHMDREERAELIKRINGEDV